MKTIPGFNDLLCSAKRGHCPDTPFISTQIIKSSSSKGQAKYNRKATSVTHFHRSTSARSRSYYIQRCDAIQSIRKFSDSNRTHKVGELLALLSSTVYISSRITPKPHQLDLRLWQYQHQFQPRWLCPFGNSCRRPYPGWVQSCMQTMSISEDAFWEASKEVCGAS